MATVKIDTFHGIAPRNHPSQLADGMAVLAHNCRLKTGKLVPIHEPLKLVGKMIRLENGLTRIRDAKSIHIWRKKQQIGDSDIEFLAYPGITHVAASNIADDEYDRIFLSGETGVEFDDGEKVWPNAPAVLMSHLNTNSIIRHCICKRKLPAPKLTLADGGRADPDNIQETFYFQTWVDPYGYESGVSPQSVCRYGIDEEYKAEPLQYNDGDRVTIAALEESEVPNGGGTVDNPKPGYKRRIYKVWVGNETASINFVTEFADAPWQEHTITIDDENNGEVLTELRSPPGDLTNMTFMPGDRGFYVGYSKSRPKTVMFSDIDIPVSWPIDFQYDIDENIVGLAVTANSVFVLTEGNPWVFSGTEPVSMTSVHLASSMSCVSERSICAYNNRVFFASNVGIGMIYNDATSGTVVTNLTEKIFTKEQWQAYNPSSCLMRIYDDALHLFFTISGESGVSHKGLIIDMNENMDAVTTHSEEATCLCTDNKTDTLYYVRTQDGEV